MSTLSCVVCVAFIHRIGRTGRAGANGAAHTFVTLESDRALFPALADFLGKSGATVPSTLRSARNKNKY